VRLPLRGKWGVLHLNRRRSDSIFLLGVWKQKTFLKRNLIEGKKGSSPLTEEEGEKRQEVLEALDQRKKTTAKLGREVFA